MSQPTSSVKVDHLGTRVSVVVPSYNHAQFVAMTLRSIMKQSCAPAELVVIDDGSTDDSPAMIEQTLKGCPFPCELIVRSNRGLCATLNEGLARTEGDYFAYLGSDDVWLPNFLKDRVRLLQSRTDAVLAYGHAYFVDEQSRIVDCTADWANYVDGDVRAMLLNTIAPMSPTVLYRRAALAKESWNEKARLEDYDLYLRLSTIGEFAFDPNVLSGWRLHGKNTSLDQIFMLNEHLAAQRAVAPTLGLSDRELEKLQTRTRFSRAEDFIRLGDKRTAIRLMGANLSGVRSPRILARMLIRLGLPMSFIRKRKADQQRRASERFGSIEL
ncbi:MAG TPA: glycosyltransferase family 2 protein [Pyrinomonadaceae bacterium]|nr:glycosyltransferase family 2 protein [Pyrinomonadaceae bacterium]